MWLIDSGASEHFCRDRSAFFDYEQLQPPLTVHVGGSQVLQAVGTGSVLLEIQFTSSPVTLNLVHVLHVPGLRKNLISVSALLKTGWTVQANRDRFSLSHNSKEITATPDNGLFTLHAKIITPSFENEVFVSTLQKNPSLQQAHEILGHINKAAIIKFMRTNGLKYKSDHEDCEPCLKGKMNRASYRLRPETSRPN